MYSSTYIHYWFLKDFFYYHMCLVTDGFAASASAWNLIQCIFSTSIWNQMGIHQHRTPLKNSKNVQEFSHTIVSNVPTVFNNADQPMQFKNIIDYYLNINIILSSLIMLFRIDSSLTILGVLIAFVHKGKFSQYFASDSSFSQHMYLSTCDFGWSVISVRPLYWLLYILHPCISWDALIALCSPFTSSTHMNGSFFWLIQSRNQLNLSVILANGFLSVLGICYNLLQGVNCPHSSSILLGFWWDFIVIGIMLSFYFTANFLALYFASVDFDAFA